MKRATTYSRDMREYAKNNRLELATLDLPGWTIQKPVDAEELAFLENFALEWTKFSIAHQERKKDAKTD